MNSRFSKWVLVAGLILATSLGLWGQGSGDLTGVITDPSGAVVPKVTVKLTNDATGIARTTDTTGAGVYRFTALPVGTYTLLVDAKGFRAVSVKGVAISVGTTANRDIALQVGPTTETVTVEAGAQMVQTTESSVSQLVDQRVWQQMPMETRNQNRFIELVAGAVPDAMAGSTRGAAVNGARGGAGNYLVDGMDNNDQGQGGRGQLGDDPGGAVTSISPEAIQEYRIITNSFSAEYGKAGGFVTDTVLKSGSNQFHGSLFEYNRVQVLAANSYFSNREGLKDSLVRNQFGGSFGGPIIKDKAFFYGSLEFHRMRTGSPATATGTTQQFLDFVNSGAFATFIETQYGLPAGSMAGSSTLGPIFSNLFATQNFPLATTNLSYQGQGLYTSGDVTGVGVTYPVPVYGTVFLTDPYHLNEYRISGKVDYKLTNNDMLSGFWLQQHANSGDPIGGGGGDIGPAYINDGVSINTGVNWTHTFTPTLLNAFKASYLRHRSDFPAPPNTLGIPMILTAWDPLTTGFGLYAGLPQYFTDNQFQFQDQLALVHGKHSFKFGGEYRRTRNGSRFYNDTFGTFYPYGIEDMATDLNFTDALETAMWGAPVYGSVYYASAAVDTTTGALPDVYRGYRANEFAFFAQDDWRITDRLTLNLGVRWEYFGPPHNFKPNIDSNFYFGSPVTPAPTASTNPFFPLSSSLAAQVATGTFQIRNNEIWNKDTNNFGPRVGFAYDVLGNQKLVLRAGAGIMYDRIYNNLFENIRFNPPYFADFQIGAFGNGVPAGQLSTPGLYTVPFTSTPMFATGYTAAPNPRHMDQNMVSPYYEQFHLGVQWEFAHGFVFEPEYIATLGHKLTAYRDINTYSGRTVPGYDNTRPNPNIGADNYRSNDYSSNYHGLQLTVRKAFSGGLGFNASYTWSKALDTISDAFNNRNSATVTDPQNIRYDYGPADFNLKHRFVTSVSYDLPFFKQNRWIGGWSVNSIISVQSGVPFSPYASSANDRNRNGLATDRVVPVSGSPMDTTTGGNPADGYFDPALWTRYTCPASVNGGLWCDVPIGRNSMTGPGYANVDLGINKKFKISERFALSFQGNFFNLFNHANFGLPGRNLSSPGSFGKSTSTFSPRVTQLALRLDF